MENNHVEMGILWAGGWDDYIVDLDDMIDDDGTYGNNPTIHERVNSHLEDSHLTGKYWVRTYFSGRMSQLYPGKAIRVVRHLGGGD